jgi:hypothetical protein
MKILFKYTSRSRPKEFNRGLNSIADNITGGIPDVLISLDLNDPKLDEYKSDGDKRETLGRLNLTTRNGVSKNKVDAINRDIETCGIKWDLLINMSDDMIFTVKGFDDKIRSIFNSHFPLGDGFLHLNDGHQGENVSTMSIMDRKYYERDRYIYHPEYKSLWCDVEATEVAWMRGRYAYAPIVLFDHLHPAWGLAPNDAQYLKSESKEMWDHDKSVIDRHRANNYGIVNPVKPFKYQTL